MSIFEFNPFIGGFKDGFESGEEKIRLELLRKRERGEIMSMDELRTLQELEAKKKEKEEKGQEYPSPDPE